MQTGGADGPVSDKPVRARRRLRWVPVAGQMIAGATLIVVACRSPWVSYQVNGSAQSSSLHLGAVGIPLVLIGGLSLALSVWQAADRSRWRTCAQSALGALGLLVTVASSLSRLSDANRLIALGGTTSYANGPELAAIAALTIVVLAVTQLGAGESARDPGTGLFDLR